MNPPTTTVHGPGATTGSRGRPVALIVAFVVLVAVYASIAPVVQEAIGLSWDVLGLIMLGPALVALVLWLVVRRWFPADWSAARPGGVVASAAGAVAFVVVYALITARGLGVTPSLPPVIAGVPLVGVIALQALGALGEEIGWRGLMQAAGERLMSPLVTVLVMGFLFGVTHLGYWTAGPVFVGWFSLSTTLMSLGIFLIWRGSFWQRMLPATLIHLGVNLTGAAVHLDLTTLPGWQLPLPATAACVFVGLPAWLLRHKSASDRSVQTSRPGRTERR